MLRVSEPHQGLIWEHFPEKKLPEGRPGRPSVPTRDVVDTVLWILNTGAQ